METPNLTNRFSQSLIKLLPKTGEKKKNPRQQEIEISCSCIMDMGTARSLLLQV